MIIRPGTEGDLEAVAAIQAASPEAARWEVAQYLQYRFEVAVSGASVAGFLVARAVAPGECELLNLVVSPAFRRRGAGRRLVESLLAKHPADTYLEVRESNEAARKFYEIIGFREVGRRPGYYHSPDEPAIVMKFHSC